MERERKGKWPGVTERGWRQKSRTSIDGWMSVDTRDKEEVGLSQRKYLNVYCMALSVAVCQSARSQWQTLFCWWHCLYDSRLITQIIMCTSCHHESFYSLREYWIRHCPHRIEQIKFTTFLGVHIDEHLSWTIHINNLSHKIAWSVGMLNKLTNVLPLYTMKTLYNIISSAILCSVMVEYIHKSFKK